MPNDVAITGVGLVTPAGIGAETAWNAALAGTSCTTANPDLAELPVTFSATVNDFDGRAVVGREARKLSRFSQFAIAAAEQAVSDAGLNPETWNGERVGVVIGCGMGDASFWEREHNVLTTRGPERVSPYLVPRLIPNMAAGHVAIRLGAHGPNLATTTACASGATAIGTALDLVRSGRCDVVIAGGTEAAVTPLAIAGFASVRALSTRNDDPASASRPFDRDRDGFVIAEGAGVVVVEDALHAAQRGVSGYANLAGYGASGDAYHATAPAPDGQWIEHATRTAVADASLSLDDIGAINAHGTSTVLNDVTEAAMIHRVFGRDVPVTSTKGVTGHTLGAAGAIEAVFSVLSLRDQVVPPTANLTVRDPKIDVNVVSGKPYVHRIDAVVSNSFGFGGQNAVLVFARPDLKR